MIFFIKVICLRIFNFIKIVLISKNIKCILNLFYNYNIINISIIKITYFDHSLTDILWIPVNKFLKDFIVEVYEYYTRTSLIFIIDVNLITKNRLKLKFKKFKKIKFIIKNINYSLLLFLKY